MSAVNCMNGNFGGISRTGLEILAMWGKNDRRAPFTCSIRSWTSGCLQLSDLERIHGLDHPSILANAPQLTMPSPAAKRESARSSGTKTHSGPRKQVNSQDEEDDRSDSVSEPTSSQRHDGAEQENSQHYVASDDDLARLMLDMMKAVRLPSTMHTVSGLKQVNIPC